MKEKRNIAISLPVTGEDEWQAVKEPIMSGWITSGPKVNQFEKLFAEKHDVNHAIAVTSATTALHLALLSLEIGDGDEVIVPAFTWVSTANVVLYCNAKLVFVDIDTNTFNIDLKDLKRKITSKTKAIIPVHLFGLCADVFRIREIVGDKIFIIEDAACAAGAMYKNQYAGSLGDIGCFSFHPRKSITTGEGGMITTNNKDLAEKVSMLRNHGASISEEQRHNGPKPYILPEFNLLGYNYRMTDLQGAMGVAQINKLDQFIKERSKWAQFYLDEFNNINWLKLPVIREGYKHGWQSFVTLIDESKSPGSRSQIMEKLQNAGISTRPGTHAVHMLSYYKNLMGINDFEFPNAKAANDFSMSIPLHNRMNKDDFKYVVKVIKSL
ncbi:MAG: perosamine synthetase [Crocinitomicaceae bacterium]|nr:perosamine synthetase [Crocinitomicaceae bacterium]